MTGSEHDRGLREEARRPWELVAVAGLVVLAAWLRLRELGLVEFKLDEARAVELGREVLAGDLPSTGLESSVGALNPPLFAYLTAIPLAVRDDPRAATAFVGVLAAVAVGLFYAALRPRLGGAVALAAAAFLATAPWAVLYGRKLWAQSMLPVVTVGLLWALLVVLERPRTRVVALLPVLLCLAFQLNFSAVPLVVPVALVLLLRARAVHALALAAGLVAAVLLLAPWLVHEARNGFEDVVTLATEGRGDGATLGAGTVEAVRQTARVAGSLGWDYVTGESAGAFADDAGAAWTAGRAAGVAIVVLLAAGIATSAVAVVRGARTRRGRPHVRLDAELATRALLLAWLAGVWLFHAGSDPERVYPHYLIAAYPAAFALAALGLGDIARAAGRARAGAVTAVVAGTAAAFVAFTLAFHELVREQGGTAGDYGVAFRHKRALARAAEERGARVAEPVVDFLVTGRLDEQPPPDAPLVAVEDRLHTAGTLPCDGELRFFGPLEACLPNAADAS